MDFMEGFMNKNTNVRKLCLMIVMVFMTFLSCTTSAMAKPDNAQKTLIREAAAAYDKEDYDTALSKFQEAYNIAPAPALLYNMGRVCESKGDREVALGYYKQFVIQPNIDDKASDDALSRIERLDKIIAIEKDQKRNPVNIKPAARPASPSAGKAGGCIDINNGSLADLTNLNGIGEKKAQLIIDSRNSQGPYKSISDLERVKGFGAKSIEKFKDQICPIGDGPVTNQAAPAPAHIANNAPSPNAAPAATGNCIDINTGSLADLSRLKGIGEKKAQLIIDSRNSQGPYKSISELERVKGFGAKSIEKFRDQICPIDGSAAPAPQMKQAVKQPDKANNGNAKRNLPKSEPGLVIDI
jgi:competence protein ComEA